jgi:hypothetical protein
MFSLVANGTVITSTLTETVVFGVGRANAQRPKKLKELGMSITAE